MSLTDLSSSNNEIVKSIASETGNGLYVTIGSIRLNGRNPIKEAQTLASSLDLQNYTLYLLFHPLHYYGVETLLSRLPQNSLLIAIEPIGQLEELWYSAEAKLNNLKDARLILAQDNNSPFTIESILELVKKQLHHFTNIRRIEPLYLNAGSRIVCKAREQIIAQSQELLRTYWRNHSTLLYMGRLWVKNIINNIAFANTLVNKTEVLFLRKACLVCGAGPSLQDSLAFILENRQNIYLIAADSALPSLLAAGIRPNALVIVEAQQANALDFIASSEADFELWCDLSSHSNLIHQFKNKTIRWFVSEFSSSNLWRHLKSSGLQFELVPALGSVGVVALYLARKSGFKNIAFTGLDFSYFPGKSHAANSPHHIYNLYKNQRLYSGFYPLPNKDLKHLSADTAQITDNVLSSYASLASMVIEEYESQGFKLYDLRSSGLSLGNEALRTIEDFKQVLDIEARQEVQPNFLQFNNQTKASQSFFSLINSAIIRLRAGLNKSLITKMYEPDLLKLIEEFSYLFYSVLAFDPKNLQLGLLPYLLNELQHFQKLMAKIGFN